jgi:hypothetical protein
MAQKKTKFPLDLLEFAWIFFTEGYDYEIWQEKFWEFPYSTSDGFTKTLPISVSMFFLIFFHYFKSIFALISLFYLSCKVSSFSFRIKTSFLVWCCRLNSVFWSWWYRVIRADSLFIFRNLMPLVLTLLVERNCRVFSKTFIVESRRSPQNSEQSVFTLYMTI